MTCDAVNHLIKENDLEFLLEKVYKLLNDNGYFIFDIYDKEKICFNKEIVSNRDNGIKASYYITAKDNLINTNVIIKQNDKFIYKTDVIERIYKTDEILKILSKNNFKIVKVSDKIMNEEQRFKDKLYIICKKES